MADGYVDPFAEAEAELAGSLNDKDRKKKETLDEIHAICADVASDLELVANKLQNEMDDTHVRTVNALRADAINSSSLVEEDPTKSFERMLFEDDGGVDLNDFDNLDKYKKVDPTEDELMAAFAFEEEPQAQSLPTIGNWNTAEDMVIADFSSFGFDEVAPSKPVKKKVASQSARAEKANVSAHPQAGLLVALFSKFDVACANVLSLETTDSKQIIALLEDVLGPLRQIQRIAESTHTIQAGLLVDVFTGAVGKAKTATVFPDLVFNQRIAELRTMCTALIDELIEKEDPEKVKQRDSKVRDTKMTEAPRLPGKNQDLIDRLETSQAKMNLACRTIKVLSGPPSLLPPYLVQLVQCTKAFNQDLENRTVLVDRITQAISTLVTQSKALDHLPHEAFNLTVDDFCSTVDEVIAEISESS